MSAMKNPGAPHNQPFNVSPHHGDKRHWSKVGDGTNNRRKEKRDE